MPSDNADENRWYALYLAPHEPMLRAWLSSRYPDDLDVDDVVRRGAGGVSSGSEGSGAFAAEGAQGLPVRHRSQPRAEHAAFRRSPRRPLLCEHR